MPLPVQPWVALSGVTISSLIGFLTQWVKAKGLKAKERKDISTLQVNVRRLRKSDRIRRGQITGLANADKMMVEELKVIRSTARDNGDKTATALERLGGVDAKLDILLEDRPRRSGK